MRHGRARNAALSLFGLIALAGAAPAYQSFLGKAKKFGARDCLFCHKYEDGGEGWNERGQWLIDEKARRNAEKIDIEWLADYKPREGDRTDKDKEEKPKPPSR
ncbi:MAG: hypothetical protein DMG07_17010 [Acidobacteria bacterium]|nr:MAG: hypothetical protein DMG07_17010 [Acidobacteriota bacterium]